jgi:hypothetical protein
MNSDKYSGSNSGQDYAHEEGGDIWAKSDMPEYTELPEPDEFTKLAHKVVIYGTVLAVVAIGISDAVAAGVSAGRNTESAPAAVTVEANYDRSDDSKSDADDHERAVVVDQSDARHLDHTFENSPK